MCRRLFRRHAQREPHRRESLLQGHACSVHRRWPRLLDRQQRLCRVPASHSHRRPGTRLGQGLGGHDHEDTAERSALQGRAMALEVPATAHTLGRRAGRAQGQHRGSQHLGRRAMEGHPGNGVGAPEAGSQPVRRGPSLRRPRTPELPAVRRLAGVRAGLRADPDREDRALPRHAAGFLAGRRPRTRDGGTAGEEGHAPG